MDDIWIISWFNHTAFDANPIWKSPKYTSLGSDEVDGKLDSPIPHITLSP